MDENLWIKAKELFHEALAKAPEERDGFLKQVCGNDEGLHDQVQQLIDSYESGFMNEPALDKVVEAISAADRLEAGSLFGRYSVVRLIGSGGMGEVYLAHDDELDRPVALKLLHRDVAEDKERLRRFIQEARAASALNHPNILTIYEIGAHEGARFIVSEYIDGDTLRDRMRSGLTPAESVDITCQVATALQTAHSAGIVHRDIKPENIMLRRDGLVKILDFGLAKLTEADDQPLDQNAPLSRVHTTPGLVMGTVAYMSPEQASGKPVDSRTDLWSLGVVLYEMLTGQSPFKGDSSVDLVNSILKYEGTPIVSESVPPELRPICAKALARDQKSRYQSAQQFLHDLQGEKKRMEYAIQQSFITAANTDELKTQLIRPHRTISAEYIVTTVKRHKYASIAAISLIVLSAITLSVYRYNGATPPNSAANFSVIDSSTDERDLKFSKLPISNQTRDDIAISPDGKYIAYLGGKGIRLLDLSSSVETDISSEGGWDLRFSRDSKFVYYVFGGYPYVIKKVSIAGGSPQKITDDTDNGPSFSTDGTSMLFAREIPRESGGAYKGKALIIANADGSNERIIATVQNRIWCSAAVSPDGKTVACSVTFEDENGRYVKLVGFDIADGRQRVISEKNWIGISGAVWLPNGNLVLTAKEKYSDPSQLWLISPTGEPKALTSGLISYQGLSATSRGDVLVTRQGSGTNSDSADLWVMQGNDAGKAKRLTTSGELQGRFTWTPDGRILFCSDVSGNRDLWIMNADGSGRRQLTRDPAGDAQPAVSKDGKYIAFTSDRVSGIQQIFRADIDGGNVKQLTQGRQKGLASFSPDGKWVYFVEIPSKTVWKVSVNGGDPVLVATALDGWNLTGIDVNRADGRLVYGLQQFKDDVRRYKLAIVPVVGEPKLIDVSAEYGWERPRWAPDNRTILAPTRAVDKAADIWSIPVDGKGKPRQLTDFKTPAFFGGYSWSADGKQLLVSRTVFTMNPVLIRRSSD